MAALPYEDGAATALDGDPYELLLLLDELPLSLTGLLYESELEVAAFP